jgi:hypothetical protein
VTAQWHSGAVESMPTGMVNSIKDFTAGVAVASRR